MHHDNCSNLLFREEITLGKILISLQNKTQIVTEQYHGDLKQLCDQIERILAMKDCVEMVN